MLPTDRHYYLDNLWCSLYCSHMPRIARIVAPGHPYHVTQRGNYRQAVFRNDEDRSQYLSWVNEYSRKFHLSVWAYCLMDNHVHSLRVDTPRLAASV